METEHVFKFFIGILIVFSMMFISMGVEQYNKNQCRIEAIKAGIEADKINQACGFR